MDFKKEAAIRNVRLNGLFVELWDLDRQASNPSF